MVQKTSTDDVYSTILQMIFSGRFTVGDRLVELNLAEELQVSRTPVREALRQLSATGYVEIEKNRGAVVAKFDDLQEIFHLRKLLEGYAAGLAAERISKSELDQLFEIQADYDQTIRSQGTNYREKASEINLQFHKVIYAAARSSRLQHLLERVTFDVLSITTFRQYPHKYLLRSSSQHEQLLEALQRRDRQLADTAMQVHIGLAEYTMLPESKKFTERTV